jgi:hypothetical protein|nr:MAG TPA: Minor capsid protein from bacteriophage [Caudoviricetes sp.]
MVEKVVNVGQAIIDWLKTYVPETITTDSLNPEAVSYGLYKTPTQQVKKDILGNARYSDYYTFMVRLDTITDDNMISNQDYLQGLCDWIEDRDRENNYPDLKGYTCTGISVSTPFYVGVTDEHTAVYNMTIKINYRKVI